MPYQAFEIKATASALAAPAESAERTQLLFQAKEKTQKLNSHLDALLLRIRDLRPSATDSERFSLYQELEKLCRSRRELIVELKASGLFQNEELRANLRLGARIRVQITAKLTNLLGSIKDGRLRRIAAGILGRTIGDAAIEFDYAFLLQFELEQLSEDFAKTCGELQIDFDTDASSSSGSGGSIHLSLSASEAPDTAAPRDGLSYALLELFQEHDPVKIIRQIIEETREIERELMEAAAEKKQKERLLEARLEEKAEDERIEQVRIELDLRRLQMQEESWLAA